MNHKLKVRAEWRINDTSAAPSSRRCLRCSLSCQQAAALVLAAAKHRGLMVAGFRSGRAPAKLVYVYHQLICDSWIVAELRNNPPEPLTERMGKAFTPPKFTALKWDGESDYHIDVNYFEQPTAPDPAAAMNTPSRLPAEPLAMPQPGRGVQVADFLPPALQAQGVLTGLNLQLSLQRVDQPRQPPGGGALGTPGPTLPDPAAATAFPGAARTTTGLDPHPAPAVPHVGAPVATTSRTLPGAGGYSTPALAAPGPGLPHAETPHAAPVAPQAAAP